MNSSKQDRKFKILHIILALTPTNGQYNEHCLPLRKLRDITISTYFKSTITPPEEIKLYDGDNTVSGFVKSLKIALQENEFDVIHVHTPHAGVLLILTLLLSGMYRKIQPLTVHTIQNSYQNFKPRNKLMFLPSFYYFRHLIFCSHASFESFPAFLKWLGRDRMHVVQNAVDLDRIDRVVGDIKQNSFNEHFIVSTVGLIKIKNPQTVLEAFRHGSDSESKLVYMGDGHLRPMILERIKIYGLEDQVTLTGMIERNRVFEHFVQSDVFVSASYGEGLPVAVMEAMASRSPVIISDIPPHREIANSVEFIPLIEPDDNEGFAKAIESFRKMPPSERKVIGQKCREVIEQQFSLPVMHAGLAEIYSQITGYSIPYWQESD